MKDIIPLIHRYKYFSKFVFCCFTACFSLFLSSEVFAESDYIYEDTPLQYENTYYEQEDTLAGNDDTTTMKTISDGPIRKLGRGVSNVLFGVFEVFIQPYKINETEGGVAALTYGLLKGIFYFGGRVVVGVVDIVTFPVPLPGASTSKYTWSSWGYGPLMEPEWIFTIEDNPYDFVYPNYPAN